jgi:hypothetical protein
MGSGMLRASALVARSRTECQTCASLFELSTKDLTSSFLRLVCLLYNADYRLRLRCVSYSFRAMPPVSPMWSPLSYPPATCTHVLWGAIDPRPGQSYATRVVVLANEISGARLMLQGLVMPRPCCTAHKQAQTARGLLNVRVSYAVG